ncbi:hypothetical protein OIU84_000467 [Salix udensis]|uniref:RanBP2-type domain-containing protein n=1 Tax=Salix udensis TaxID=889485 RepID=A0AAD6PNZ8_9ROSI|nr:hypothetical protein OIU84_000467 [Salix udensis]
MSLTAGGDWMCSACQHLNFKKREMCQLCGYPKLTTMLAGQAATAVARQKAIMREVGMAATLMEVIVLDGKLVIGFAPGRDVESIIMLAGWNALDAEHPGNTVVDINENDLLLTAYGPVFSAITFQF